MIKVILEGEHTNTYQKGWYTISPLTSSVTLIKTGKHTILVDSGSLAFRKTLLSRLKKEQICPQDVDIIFNTHFHLDHVSNNTVFYNAKQYSEHAIFDLKTGKTTIFTDRSLYTQYIPKNIEFFPTPGHFHGHMSLLYTFKGIKYVVAGDVIREDVIRGTGYSANGISETLYKSMKLIFNKADVIIPGHGRVIEGTLFQELKDILFSKFAKRNALKS